MNPEGTPENLVASHPGNVNSVRSGVYSPRLMGARADEILEELDLPSNLDAAGKLAAREAATLTARIEAIERELDTNGMSNPRGEDRTLVQRRDGFSRRLGEANAQLAEALARARSDPAVDASAPPRADLGSSRRRLAAIAANPGEKAADRIAADRTLMDHHPGA
jgi:hypothetical protein